MKPEPQNGSTLEAVRAFVAVLLEPPVLDELLAVQKLLRQTADELEIRWVRAGQLHLTLCFLGDMPLTSVEPAGAALTRVASSMQPLTLCLAQPGCFPEGAQPRVVWVGLSGDLDRLSVLQSAIDAAVSPFGTHGEERRFHPHLTLGRARRPLPAGPRWVGALAGGVRVRPVPWSVRDVHLVRSELTPAGSRYTVLRSAALGIPAATKDGVTADGRRH